MMFFDIQRLPKIFVIFYSFFNLRPTEQYSTERTSSRKILVLVFDIDVFK